MDSFSRMFCARELEPVLVYDATQSLLLGTVGSLEVKLLGRHVDFFCFQSIWSFHLLNSEPCRMGHVCLEFFDLFDGIILNNYNNSFIIRFIIIQST